ncbi:hypothetical protein GT347_04910 [Xylophilus rhododendri]|uniref:Uncharacterized protein n=1 Tax=Xylophilus rhododendri TaxID=2697032 RepID=A0A857J0J8_9BURK|nr:hypothetical protein [Xylophilus rhododendri]QHI97380.1 hypothetical protein GT347_04910 [Xylophilus rhododendri]
MARADIDLRRLSRLAAALVLVIAVAVGSVFGLLHHWRLPPGGDAPGSAGLQAVPAPRLQSAPQDDLAAYRAEQRRQLDAVGWEDRAQGRVRIPVADAIELVAQGKGVR